MRTFRSFMFHKFTIPQSLLLIAAPVVAALAANQAAEAANLSNSAVTGIGLAALFATLIPLQIVFYRRTRT